MKLKLHLTCLILTWAVVFFGFNLPGLADLVIAGNLQTEQGDPNDWDPENSSLIMTEVSSGVYTQTVVNLVDTVLYEFKVLNDRGTPPAMWGDPEVTPDNVMAYGDSDGIVDIMVDTNASNQDGFAVVWVNTDNAHLQVVGDFQDEAGGVADWNPIDHSFLMTPQGGGLYTYTATISTPGSYVFKATNGFGWALQVGTDGFNANAIPHPFTTTTPNEQVIMSIDLANQTFDVTPVVPQVVVPESLTVTRGINFSGGAPELAESDNADLSLQRNNSDIQSRTEFEVKSTSPFAIPTSMEITLEGAVFARSTVTQSIDLFDYQTGAWESIDSRKATRLTDSTATVSVTGDLSRFVEPGTQCVEARIRYQSAIPRQAFASNTDQFIWRIVGQ